LAKSLKVTSLILIEIFWDEITSKCNNEQDLRLHIEFNLVPIVSSD
jgi:hypothetical protein